MKKLIRIGAFETNSSSNHTLVIHKNVEFENLSEIVPKNKTLCLQIDEDFISGGTELYGFQNKIEYIYADLINRNEHYMIDELNKKMKELGFEKIVFNNSCTVLGVIDLNEDTTYSDLVYNEPLFEIDPNNGNVVLSSSGFFKDPNKSIEMEYMNNFNYLMVEDLLNIALNTSAEILIDREGLAFESRLDNLDKEKIFNSSDSNEIKEKIGSLEKEFAKQKKLMFKQKETVDKVEKKSTKRKTKALENN